MRRRNVIAISAAGIALFLVVSALLARVFTIDSAERSAVTALVSAEARGNLHGVINRLRGCGSSQTCQAGAAHNVTQLKHPGIVTIIRFDSSAGFSLGSTVGTARVAWSIGSGLPIVQCVRVRRAGNVLSGLRIELLAVSRRIHSDETCPPPGQF